jgi:hypothetical protein
MPQCRWCGRYYDVGPGIFCSSRCELDAGQHGIENPQYSVGVIMLALIMTGSFMFYLGWAGDMTECKVIGGLCIVGGILGYIWNKVRK